MAVNLAEKKHIVLGKHNNSVHNLAVEGQILISGSERSDKCAELKFWDIKSMTKIAEMELPNLSKFSFVFGKIVAAVGKSLIQWDYLVSHKGVQNSKS